MPSAYDVADRKLELYEVEVWGYDELRPGRLPAQPSRCDRR